MIFKKINEPTIIQNTDFKTCILFISYPIEETDEAKLKILRNLSFDKSAKYSTEKEMYEVKVNNYCLSYYERIVQLGKTSFLELAVYFPSKNSLGKDVLEDNLKLIKEIIYNPYLENGTFPIKEINDIKEVMKNNINRKFKDAMWYFNYKNDKTIDEDGFLINKTDENPNILDDVTPEKLYELYQSTVNKSPIVFLIGDIPVEESKQKIKEILLSNKEDTVVFEQKYTNYCKDIPNTPKEVVEKTNFKSTGVYYNYKVKDLTNEKDIALLKIVRDLLSSNSSRLLFNQLRKENDLVYRCGAYTYGSFGSLTLWAITGKDNIEKVQKEYEKVMNKVLGIDYIEEKLPLIKEEYKLDDDLVKEKLYDTLMQDVDKYLEAKEKTIYELIKDITPEEVQEFITNRLILVAKYTGVGEENE